MNDEPIIPLESVVSGLSDVNRWRILGELSLGQPLMVVEIAEKIGRSPDSTSKHLAVLRKTGLVVQNRAQLYSIPKRYLPEPAKRLVDYGHCLLRLDAEPT